MDSAVTVLVVDDQDRFRSVARTVVEHTDGFVLVGDASDGDDAVARAAEVHPALVLMDINMPGTDGLVATRRILEAAPGTVVVLLSSYDRADLPAGVLDGGAADYVHKAELGPECLDDLWRRHGHRAAHGGPDGSA